MNPRFRSFLPVAPLEPIVDAAVAAHYEAYMTGMLERSPRATRKGAEAFLGERLARAYYRGKDRRPYACISLKHADEIAALCGTHPLYVWGYDLWIEALKGEVYERDGRECFRQTGNVVGVWVKHLLRQWAARQEVAA